MSDSLELKIRILLSDGNEWSLQDLRKEIRKSFPGTTSKELNQMLYKGPISSDVQVRKDEKTSWWSFKN